MKNKNHWFAENHKDILNMGFKYKKSLFDKNSSYQNVKIIETEGFGNMLINDNIVMTCERDEFVYHEMISHVPLFSHPHPKDVLIIGGGDGGTAREVLKHKYLERCIMVEIDSLVVEACKKHLKTTAVSFNNSKLDLKIEDGFDFVARYQSAFDIIIVDSSDPIGPSSVLFGSDFYKNIHKALKTDGIVVAQAESPFYEIEIQKNMLKICQGLFHRAGFYNYSNLTYPSGLWSFLFASKSPHPIKDFQPDRVKNSGLSFRYYNEEIHKSSFTQPQFAKEAFGKLWTL